MHSSCSRPWSIRLRTWFRVRVWASSEIGYENFVVETQCVHVRTTRQARTAKEQNTFRNITTIPAIQKYRLTKFLTRTSNPG